MSGQLKTTVLHAEHQRAGAKLVPFHGWDMPLHYGSQLEEHHQVRRGCGIFDVSHMQAVDITGEGAAAFLSRMLTNDIERLTQPGQAQYTLMLNDEGGILDDLIVYRRGADAFLIICNASNREKIAAHVASLAKGKASFADRSDELALIAFQGPKAVGLAATLGDADLVKLGSFHGFTFF